MRRRSRGGAAITAGATLGAAGTYVWLAVLFVAGESSGTPAGGGILVSTGAGGTGLLLAVAAALAAAGVAAVRFAPRLRGRMPRN